MRKLDGFAHLNPDELHQLAFDGFSPLARTVAVYLLQRLQLLPKLADSRAPFLIICDMWRTHVGTLRRECCLIFSFPARIPILCARRTQTDMQNAINHGFAKGQAKAARSDNTFKAR
jgi:hypothetical protein